MQCQAAVAGPPCSVSSHVHPTAMFVFRVAFVLLPTVLVFLTAIALLGIIWWRHKRQSSESRSAASLQGVVTVTLVSAVYLLSYVPAIGHLPGWLYLLCLNNICNFAIYTISIRSFRAFVWGYMRCAIHRETVPQPKFIIFTKL